METLPAIIAGNRSCHSFGHSLPIAAFHSNRVGNWSSLPVERSASRSKKTPVPARGHIHDSSWPSSIQPTWRTSTRRRWLRSNGGLRGVNRAQLKSAQGDWAVGNPAFSPKATVHRWTKNPAREALFSGQLPVPAMPFKVGVLPLQICSKPDHGAAFHGTPWWIGSLPDSHLEPQENTEMVSFAARRAIGTRRDSGRPFQ